MTDPTDSATDPQPDQPQPDPDNGTPGDGDKTPATDKLETLEKRAEDTLKEAQRLMHENAELKKSLSKQVQPAEPAPARMELDEKLVSELAEDAINDTTAFTRKILGAFQSEVGKRDEQISALQAQLGEVTSRGGIKDEAVGNAYEEVNAAEWSKYMSPEEKVEAAKLLADARSQAAPPPPNPGSTGSDRGVAPPKKDTDPRPERYLAMRKAMLDASEGKGGMTLMGGTDASD